MAGILLGVLALTPGSAQEPEVAPEVDRARRAVRLPARLQLAAFAQGEPPGHHLVTWRGGKAGRHALLQTPCSDRAVLDAFEALGAHPGDNLSEECWTERANPDHAAPDRVARGPRLELTIEVRRAGGVERAPIERLLLDRDRRGFEWRLAGNRALIERWKSGCVVCLQSCPGSKVANAKATMRHLERGQSRFEPSAWARELGEGSQLWIELRWVEER